MILELSAAGSLRGVVPVIIGEFQSAAGKNHVNGRAVIMTSLLGSPAFQNLPSDVHTAVNAQAQKLLRAHGVKTTPQLCTRTIRDVVTEILSFQGIMAHEHFNAGLMKGAMEHAQEAGMGSLVRKVQQVLTYVNMLPKQRHTLQ
jgi:hypothetical protein